MADSLSTPYNVLLNGRSALPSGAPSGVPSTQLPAGNPSPTIDQVTLSPASTQNRTTAPGTMTAADVRRELQALQSEMLKLNQRLETLIQATETSPPSPSATAPTAITAPPLAPLAQPTGAASATPAPPAVAGTLPEANAAPSKTHAVVAGDYLWKIAREKLGDATRWPEIYALNRGVIGDNPNLIQPGQTLKLPPAKPAAAPPPTSPPVSPAPRPQPPALPPVSQPNLPPAVPALPPAPPAAPPVAPVIPRPDIPAPPAVQRNISDVDAVRLAMEFGLAPANAAPSPQLKTNVSQFLDEMDAYQNAYRGKVFGPGMESLAASASETEQIRASVKQIQQALDILIKAGRLRVNDSSGRPLTGLSSSGSFYKQNTSGQIERDPSGNPVMDDAFVSAITRFKQEQGIHQNYKLADGTWAINEYVGPGTIEALKKTLLEVQATR